jgi:hypothetical protein
VTQTQEISAVENATLQPVVDPQNPPWINSLNNGDAVLVSTPNLTESESRILGAWDP